MRKRSIKKLDKDFMDMANSFGLLDQKTFVDIIEAYNFQLTLIKNLRSRIEKEGTSVAIPVGKEGVKMVSNPAVGDLNKAEILVQKLRAEMDLRIKEASEAEKRQKEAELIDQL